MYFELQSDGTKKKIQVDCRRIVSGTSPDMIIEADDIIFVAEW